MSADNSNTVTIRDVYDQVSTLRTEIHKTYVTKDEFAPVKQIAYGGAAVVLVTVVTAFLAQVVKAGGF